MEALEAWEAWEARKARETLDLALALETLPDGTLKEIAGPIVDPVPKKVAPTAMITIEPMEVTTTKTLTVALTTTMAKLARVTTPRRPARSRKIGTGMVQG